MGDAIRTRWIRVLQNLRPLEPSPEALYVEPRHGCAASIVTDFLIDPTACRKFLLVGPTGGGKSSDLRAVARKLRDKATLVMIDLDASGISAASVSAFDLLYMSAVQILRFVPRKDDAEKLFAELKAAYARGEEDALGSLETSWEGLAQFADVSSKVAAGMGAVSTAAGVPIDVAAAGATAALGTGSAMLTQIGTGLRLRSRLAGVVAETSPEGRALQDICGKIARVCRSDGKPPICVLIDGLEKMNGEAGERFRQVFEQTRLLADTRWTSVIAAPPCTLTETNSATGRGYTVRPVWGFGPDDLGGLKTLLERRLFDVGADPERDVEAEQLDRIAQKSGGLPRIAIQIAYESIKLALLQDSAQLTAAHVDVGANQIAQLLGLGLNSDHLRLLVAVKLTGEIPGDEKAATLFADGRILAYPPLPPNPLPRFVVHPLLDNSVGRIIEEGKKALMEEGSRRAGS